MLLVDLAHALHALVDALVVRVGARLRLLARLHQQDRVAHLRKFGGQRLGFDHSDVGDQVGLVQVGQVEGGELECDRSLELFAFFSLFSENYFFLLTTAAPAVQKREIAEKF